MHRYKRLCTALVLTLPLSNCALFENVETPYLSFSYYLLTYAETEAVINADISDPNIPDPPPLQPLIWRAAVLDAATKAGNGVIHPTEIASYLLTQLGSDPARHPQFGNPPCSASAIIANTDLDIDGDETDLGAVTMTASLTSSNNGNQVCNYSSSQRPSLLHWSGPQHWLNGDTHSTDPFFATVNGVDWTTRNQLHNEVTITYNAGNDHGAGGFWFIAIDQTSANWINNFDTLLVAPTGGFILED